MDSLPIGKMNIEVYNVEESPLHQIVKKLIYKKRSVINQKNEKLMIFFKKFKFPFTFGP